MDATTPPVRPAFDASERDHLEAAKQSIASHGPRDVVQDAAAVQLGQLHALIAIAESQRGEALVQWQQAHLLKTDDELADGSVVISVEESYEEPDVTYVLVVRAGRTYKLALLRTTPLAIANR